MNNNNSVDNDKRANWLFAQNCEFIAGVKDIHSFLAAQPIPEVAFLGRSNVGKSSLLNALTARKKLARVSHTPGSTSQINFFLLGKQIMLVDLPGYGYAAKGKRILFNLSTLIRTYVEGSAKLKRIYLLIDARFPLKIIDQEMMDALDNIGASYQIVMTKIDKISVAMASEHLEILKNASKDHQAMHPEILATSSRRREGLLALKKAIIEFVD